MVVVKQILFVTPGAEDYLSDSVLLGMKQIYGNRILDYPKCHLLYQGVDPSQLAGIHGKGFSLYGLLEDTEVDRSHVTRRLHQADFDLVLVGSLWRRWRWVIKHLEALRHVPTVLLDGADTPRVFPQSGELMRKARYWRLPRLHRVFPLFKRELISQHARLGVLDRIIPSRLTTQLRHVPIPGGLHPISFSIPEDKVVSELPRKTKDFPRHIVDPEVHRAVPSSHTTSVCQTEAAYYADLRASRFGITTKRSGWDCMRHYEIAANGAVICFRDLQQKPDTCAPHGLVDGTNCIGYSSLRELKCKILNLTPGTYRRLQHRSLEWVRKNTCRHLTKRLLDVLTCERV